MSGPGGVRLYSRVRSHVVEHVPDQPGELISYQNNSN